ncbi:hypothetical protein [Bacillus paranthracis]|nr:hypothetical protein [Bacillus paranthracis]
MASGCILGECPICDELIFEDEIDFDHYNNMVYRRCLNLRNNNRETIHLLHQEIQRLEKRIKELEEQNKSGQMTLF